MLSLSKFISFIVLDLTSNACITKTLQLATDLPSSSHKTHTSHSHKISKEQIELEPPFKYLTTITGNFSNALFRNKDSPVDKGKNYLNRTDRE